MLKKLTTFNLNRPGKASYEFGPLTFISGPNGGGKTTVRDAIFLAANGKHPNAPATNQGIMANFSAGPCLEIAIETSKGYFERSWTQTGKTVKGKTDGNEQAAESLRETLFKGDDFIGANDATRSFILRSIFPSLTDPKQGVIDTIKALEGGYLELPFGWNSLDFAAFIEAYEEKCMEEKKAQRQTLKRMEGLIQGTAQLDNGDAIPKTTQDDVKLAAQAHAGAQAQLEKVLADIGALKVEPDREVSGQGLEQVRAEHARLTAELSALKQADATAKTEYDLAYARYQTACAKADTENNKRARAEEALQTAFSTILQYFTDVTYAKAYEGHLHGTTETQTREAHNQLVTAKANVATLTERAKTAGGVEPTTACCPTCGAKSQEWTPEYKQERAAAAEQAVRDLYAAEQKVVELQATLDTLDKQKAEDETTKIKLAAIAAYNQAEQALAETAIVGYPVGAPELKQVEPSQIYELECAIADLADDVAAYEHNSRQRLTQIALTTAEEVRSRLQDEVARLGGMLEQTSRDREQAVAMRAALDKQTEARAEIEKAEKALDIAIKSQECLAAAALAEASKAVQPVLDIVKRFTEGVLAVPVGVRGLEFGRWHGAHWQPLSRLSGAEMAVVKAAFAVALATTSATKLVIIDELSVMTEPTKLAFIANLQKALDEKLLEQVLLLDHTPPKIEGAQYVEVQ